MLKLMNPFESLWLGIIVDTISLCGESGVHRTALEVHPNKLEFTVESAQCTVISAMLVAI